MAISQVLTVPFWYKSQDSVGTAVLFVYLDTDKYWMPDDLSVWYTLSGTGSYNSFKWSKGVKQSPLRDENALLLSGLQLPYKLNFFYMVVSLGKSCYEIIAICIDHYSNFLIKAKEYSIIVFISQIFKNIFTWLY